MVESSRRVLLTGVPSASEIVGSWVGTSARESARPPDWTASQLHNQPAASPLHQALDWALERSARTRRAERST